MSNGQAPQVQARSFRDPDGCLFVLPNRVVRLIKESAAAEIRGLIESPWFRKLIDAKQVVESRILPNDESQEFLIRCRGMVGHDGLVLEHERVDFPSFPYEWPPEMLLAAGALTLDLAEKLLPAGIGLKDATPYNVMFQGPEPVFVDVPSFEGRDPGDPRWLPYAQFQRTFTLPLLVNRYFGLPVQALLLCQHDGLHPETVYRMTGGRKLLPPFLTLVTLPTWLAARNADRPELYQRKIMANQEKAQYILQKTLTSLARQLGRAAPQVDRKSVWSDYRESAHDADYLASKDRIVTEFMVEVQPRKVLEIGCNTGHYSAIAARHGAAVVAVDHDPVVVGRTWQRARADHLDILPLVVDFGRPSPSVGWRYQECPSFLDRAQGHFDAVLMLAVLHHLLVSDRLPLAEILEVAAQITRDFLVLEYIDPEDPMFKKIARGRDHLHTDFSLPFFEESCGRFFETVRIYPTSNSLRRVYILCKKD